MRILRGLTTTKRAGIPGFISALKASRTREIALFPTCLDPEERRALYRALADIRGLAIPHVHLRADTFPGELDLLMSSFGTQAFNIHPRSSSHPFGPLPAGHAGRIFVENVEAPPDPLELVGAEDLVPAGLCPDFSHLENARLHGRTAYLETMDALLKCYPVGCCHISAIRVGLPNEWNGEWDHHTYGSLSDFDYMASYLSRLPPAWASLELENSFEEQGEALDYIFSLLGK